VREVSVYTVAKGAVEKGLQFTLTEIENTKKRTLQTVYGLQELMLPQDSTAQLIQSLIDAMNTKGVEINRKVLASLAVDNPKAFADVVKFVSK
jgi:large subunit ribosomal protein L20